MIGDIGLGVLKLLTFGVFGIFTMIDWFLISGRTKEKNFNQVMILADIKNEQGIKSCLVIFILYDFKGRKISDR